MNETTKLKSHLLEGKNVSYYFTTRNFGFSKSPYKSCNFGYHVGDNEKDVLQNHKLLALHLDYHVNNLVYMNQIHSNHVTLIRDTTYSVPITTDGIITQLKNKPLMVMSADCTPLILYDKQTQTIAAIHVGRQGAFKNIIKETFKNTKLFTGETIAILGPSIHQCCYEVGSEIALEARELQYDFSIKEFNTKYYLDVNAIIIHQLKTEGIDNKNIEILEHCTSCENEYFFSYRKEGVTGRMAAVIMLL